PGRLRELLGVRVEEMRPLVEGDEVALNTGATVTEWTELLEVTDAEVLARYAHGELQGLPAVTRAARGAGHAVYLSARLRQDSRDAFLAATAARLGITPTLPGAAQQGLEAVRRRGDRADHLFLLHHGEEAVTARGAGRGLVSGRATAARLRIEAGGSAVLRGAPGGEGVLAEHCASRRGRLAPPRRARRDAPAPAELAADGAGRPARRHLAADHRDLADRDGFTGLTRPARRTPVGRCRCDTPRAPGRLSARSSDLFALLG